MQKTTVYKTMFKKDSDIKNFAYPAYKTEDYKNEENNVKRQIINWQNVHNNKYNKKKMNVIKKINLKMKNWLPVGSGFKNRGLARYTLKCLVIIYLAAFRPHFRVFFKSAPTLAPVFHN